MGDQLHKNCIFAVFTAEGQNTGFRRLAYGIKLFQYQNYYLKLLPFASKRNEGKLHNNIRTKYCIEISSTSADLLSSLPVFVVPQMFIKSYLKLGKCEFQLQGCNMFFTCVLLYCEHNLQGL